MNYLLVATPALVPYINKLKEKTSHHVQVVEHVQDIQQMIDQTIGADAIILADGGTFIGEQGLTARDIPLIIPRVHNGAALLLGGADKYRGLFEHNPPGVCFWFPQMVKPVYYGDYRECGYICHLADTVHGCQDMSLSARELAQKHGYDYIEHEMNDRLCMDLLCGNWEGNDEIVTVSAGKTVALTYTHSLFEAE